MTKNISARSLQDSGILKVLERFANLVKKNKLDLNADFENLPRIAKSLIPKYDYLTYANCLVFEKECKNMIKFNEIKSHLSNLIKDNGKGNDLIDFNRSSQPTLSR